MRDQVYESGTLTESTLDWYGQDDQGNVWYFGELATHFPDGTQTGSWTAGVNGAQPGYMMEAAPKVGDTYCQENAPGVAQDAAQVLSLTASRSVPFGSYTEIYRVLRPGGRIQIADVTIQQPVSNEGKRDIDLWTG